MHRAIAATVLLACAWTAAAQSKPSFEVVAVKPLPRPTPGDGSPFAFNVDAAHVFITGYPLFLLMTRAFRVDSPQLDAPDFTHDVFFEINGSLPPEATPGQVPEMLQTMLAERFKLAYHRETREYQVAFLKAGKSGIKLPRLPDGTPENLTFKGLPDGASQRILTGRVASLWRLTNPTGFRVVDETKLDGIYTWVQEVPGPTPDATYDERVEESFRAMVEAAGLKLEKRKVPKETIVVDHLEKTPTQN